jgi:glycyl-tRNA synthetase
VSTNPRVVEYKAREREILERLGRSLGNEDLEDVKALIEELENQETVLYWTEVRQFNLMFNKIELLQILQWIVFASPIHKVFC